MSSTSSDTSSRTELVHYALANSLFGRDGRSAESTRCAPGSIGRTTVPERTTETRQTTDGDRPEPGGDG